MKWNKKSFGYHTDCWTGRRNNMSFTISELINSNFEKDGYYVLISYKKNGESLSFNSLWVRPKFDTFEEAEIYCQSFTVDKLKKTLEDYNSKRR